MQEATMLPDTDLEFALGNRRRPGRSLGEIGGSVIFLIGTVGLIILDVSAEDVANFPHELKESNLSRIDEKLEVAKLDSIERLLRHYLVLIGLAGSHETLPKNKVGSDALCPRETIAESTRVVDPGVGVTHAFIGSNNDELTGKASALLSKICLPNGGADVAHVLDK
jgi:hypothetical protein